LPRLNTGLGTSAQREMPVMQSDHDRLARFKREAQVLASLNHPNIAAIHGLEESDGVHGLVLELIAGPTLADRLEEGPIPLDDALPIARQIAEGRNEPSPAGDAGQHRRRPELDGGVEAPRSASPLTCNQLRCGSTRRYSEKTSGQTLGQITPKHQKTCGTPETREQDESTS